MDLELIKRCWRDEAGPLPQRLEEGPVLRMLTNAEAGLRRDVRRRLRREAGYYIPMIGIAMAGLVGGFTFNRMLATGVVLLVLGAIPATLWWAERRITQAPLDRSLLQVLSDLRWKVDAAGRAYVAAYVAVFIVAGMFLAGFVWWRYGVGPQLVGTAALGAFAVLWSVRSGTSYVEQMFRRYKVELTDCLRQLEDQL